MARNWIHDYFNVTRQLSKGPFIFYKVEERGGELVGFGGPCEKKMAFEGCHPKKKFGKKGGSREIF